MRQLADQAGHHVARHARVGVERHHVGDVLRQGDVGRQEGGVVVAAQQPVQLVKLAALALPAHPARLGVVEEAAPVQEVEERRALARVALVEAGDLGSRIVEDLQVGRLLLDVAVRPVGEQREADVALRVGQVMHFEVADGFVDVVARADQRRNDDQRPVVGGNAFLEFVADQPGRLQEGQDRGVEEAERRLCRRQREEDQHHGDGRRRKAERHQGRPGHPEIKRGEQRHGNDDAGPAGPFERAQEAPAEARPVADRILELLALAGRPARSRCPSTGERRRPARGCQRLPAAGHGRRRSIR